MPAPSLTPPPTPAVPPTLATDRQPIYVHVAVGKRSEPSGPSEESLRADGRELARQCLQQIDAIENGRERFPPRLFTLWATPAFAGIDNFASLLAGIHEVLLENHINSEAAPLIGTSASAVWFDAEVRENGAVLICQASKWIKAKVAVAENVHDDPDKSAKQLLDSLRGGKMVDINPRGNRYLMTFLPGFTPKQSLAPKIVDALNRLTFGRLYLFGGVSAAGISANNFQPRIGSQFVNNRAYQRAAVAALVSSDIAYGMGINPGVETTGKNVVVTEVSDDGHFILKFDEGMALPVFEKWNTDKPLVFGTRGRDGQMTVNVPRIVDGQVRLDRPVLANTVLEIARPSSRTLQRSVHDLEKWVLRWFGIKKRQVTAVLAIGCVSRYRERIRLGYNVNKALENAAKRFSSGVHVGCYLDGEIGIDRLGWSVLTNWSVSETLIADDIPQRSELFLGFDALAEHLTAAATAPSVQEAIQRALRIIEHAGFPGGMISLVFKDEPTNRIRAQDGFGGKWKTEIVPRTNRPLIGDDILAIALRATEPVFVEEAQKDLRCNRDAAKAGEVISFFAIRLLDETRKNGVGVLQVDVGDKRHHKPSPETLSLIKTLALIVELLLNHALQAEEMTITRRLDELVKECLEMKSVDAAIQQFFFGAAKALGSDGHVRLLTPDNLALRLVAGTGPYFRQALIDRPLVSLKDPSLTVEVFKVNGESVVNDPDFDERAKPLRRRYMEHVSLGRILRDNRSFADYVIRQGEEKIGVVSFASLEPCFFTPSRTKSLDHIRQRLAHLITHFRDRDRKSKAQQALISIDTYLANRLHALKNRVKSLAASLELLKGREKDALSDEGKQRLENAILGMQPLFDTFDEAQRLGSLLSESTPPTSVHICSLVQRMVSECRERQQQESTSSVQFEVILAKPHMASAVVEMNDDQMAESLRNLLSNAARAATPGGWVRVTLDEDLHRNFCVISVQDSGESGLSRETFEAFVGGHVKTADGGLGLYLSRLFCEANGGLLDLAIAGPQPVLKISLPWRKLDT